MPSVTSGSEPQPQLFGDEKRVTQWVKDNDLVKLETAILNGQGHLLQTATSQHSSTRTFLQSTAAYMEAVDSMLRAAVSGDQYTVQQLCAYKKTMFARHPVTACSIVHLATIFGHLDLLRFLIRKADTRLINDVDKEHRTVLHYAAVIAQVEHDVTFYDVLVANGAAPDIVDSEGYTPQQYLLEEGVHDLDMIRRQNKYPLEMRDEVDSLIMRGDSRALEHLVMNGNFSLITTKVFPQSQNDLLRRMKRLRDRILAIHEGVIEDDQMSVKRLLDKSTAHSKLSSGATALHTAVINERYELAQYIALMHPDCVNDTDKSDRTPLHYAASLPEPQRNEFQQLLFKAGADKKKADEWGHPAKFYHESPEAASKLHRELISQQTVSRQQATKLSTDPSTFTMDSRQHTESGSPQVKRSEKELQELLAKGDHHEFLHKILVEGGEWYVQQWAKKYSEVLKYYDNYKQSQSTMRNIRQAINAGMVKRVKQLVEKAHIGTGQDHTGTSALHMAVQAQNQEIALHLMKTYPDSVKLVDKFGRSALHYAAGYNRNKIYNELLKHGADDKFNDREEKAPRDYLKEPLTLRPNADTRPKQFDNHLMNETSDTDDDILDGAPSENEVVDWMNNVDLQALEQIVLDGRAHLLVDRPSDNNTITDFIKALPQYQQKIDAIHRAVEEGDVRRVRNLIDRAPLAAARDRSGLTPLHKAVMYAQTDTIRFLLIKFPQSVNETDRSGRTALHYAAADRNGSHFVKILQKAGADAFIEDKHAHTPFYYRTNPDGLNLKIIKDTAVIDQLMAGELSHTLLQDLEEDVLDWLQSGNTGKLEELVLNGYGDLLLGRANEVDNAEVIDFLEILPQYQSKLNAIHHAVQTGNLRDLRALVDRKKLALCRDGRGATPLHNAIIFNQKEIAKYLLKNYPQAVNAQDHNKRSPLHFAAALGDGGAMYRMLRRAGADPDILDCFAHAPKYYLNHAGELDLTVLRMDNKTALKHVLHNRIAPSYLESSIQQWLREGNVSKLDQLVLSGCGDLLLDKTSSNADVSNFMKDLPEYLDKIEKIHRLVREGNTVGFKDSVNNRRLAVGRDRKGATPLHDAVLYGQTDILRIIAQSFPHVLNSPDYNKRTPLHYAAAARDGGHYYKILERAGADPKATDNEGRTPDYYLRNTGMLDLKVIRERDLDSVSDMRDVLNNESRADTLSRQSALSIDLASPDVDVDNVVSMAASRDAFEAALIERLAETEHRDNHLPASDAGLYLARTIGPALTKALAELVIKRPADPIEYISQWLYTYHEHLQRSQATDSGVAESFNDTRQ